MKIKPALVAMMKDALPEFALTYDKGIFYVFRKSQDDEPYQVVRFQRDGQTGALQLELAVTYDPNWSGEPAAPLGRSVSLADLCFGSGRAFDVEKDWYVYGSSPEEFNIMVMRIQKHLLQYGLPFFDRARQQLRSNPLLQLALTTRRAIEVTDEELKQLETDLTAAKHLVANLSNPKFVRFRDFLATSARRFPLPADDIGYIPRLAYELLVMKTV